MRCHEPLVGLWAWDGAIDLSPLVRHLARLHASKHCYQGWPEVHHQLTCKLMLVQPSSLGVCTGGDVRRHAALLFYGLGPHPDPSNGLCTNDRPTTAQHGQYVQPGSVQSVRVWITWTRTGALEPSEAPSDGQPRSSWTRGYSKTTRMQPLFQ